MSDLKQKAEKLIELRKSLDDVIDSDPYSKFNVFSFDNAAEIAQAYLEALDEIERLEYELMEADEYD